MSLPDLVDLIRSEGSDVTHVEAKRAGSYPDSVLATLSAFGNTPGGGVVILGLDEANGFAAVGVPDAPDYQRRLANQARQSLDPPILPAISAEHFEGVDLVVARVPELPVGMKPCRATTNGAAYLRAYDGDYRLSPQEEQAFLANRGTPVFDREPVDGTGIGDLDQEALRDYLLRCRERSEVLARSDDATVLLRTGVVDATGLLSVAGVWALGSYPQQWFPSLRVIAKIAPLPSDPPGTRGAGVAVFDGSVAALLDQSMSWVRRNTTTRIRFGVDGHGLDEPQYPPEAVRELVANALVHRDLGPHSRGESIHLTLESGKLVITNPGGLWGLTVDQLGRTPGGISRNQTLYGICRDIRTPVGRRVIEGIGSGITAIRRALADAGMTPPVFQDSGIRFTALVPSHALLGAEELAWLARLPNMQGLGDVPRHVLATMRNGAEWSNRTLRDAFPMDSTAARSVLLDLVDRGLAVPVGDGRGRVYRLAGMTPVERRREGTHGGSTRQAQEATKMVRAKLADGPLSVRALAGALPLTERRVRLALDRLIAAGLIVRNGGPGLKETTYSSVSESEDSSSE